MEFAFEPSRVIVSRIQGRMHRGGVGGEEGGEGKGVGGRVAIQAASADCRVEVNKPLITLLRLSECEHAHWSRSITVKNNMRSSNRCIYNTPDVIMKNTI